MTAISLLAAVVLHSLGAGLKAQDERQVAALLQDLRADGDPESQLEALRAISTSLDPRIPAACLPLLRSTGTSIQRNAARAIGSRWQQIAKEDLTSYTDALETNFGSGDPALENMTRRGLGLLRRAYNNSMFSRSKNGRWVVYERRGKPCLIDTLNHTEELLGEGLGDFFLPALGNEPLTGFCLWHPGQEMVALQMTVFRSSRKVWVWKHPDGLHPILSKDLLGCLKPAGGQVLPGSSLSADFKSWQGTSLEISVTYSVRVKNEALERKSRVLWDGVTDNLSIVPDSR